MVEDSMIGKMRECHGRSRKACDFPVIVLRPFAFDELQQTGQLRRLGIRYLAL